MECQYCGKLLSNKYALKKHQEKTLYCLKIQGVKEKDTPFSCSKCGRRFLHKHHLERHFQKCSEIKYRDLLEKEKERKHTINQQREECDKLKSELEKHAAVVSRYEKQLQLKEMENEELKEEIHVLKEQLSGERGRFDGYDRAATKYKPQTKTVNNYVHPKLLHIGVENIRPFTIETVQQEIEEGNFTREMFDDGKLGILHFVSNMISMTNGDGVLERSYACTDSSRHKFHRLVESKEWKTDNGAHFLNDVLNQLSEPVAKYFIEILDRRKKLREEVRDMDEDYMMENDAICAYYTQKIDALKPIYDGVVKDAGESREKLFTTLRNKISGIASV